MKIAIASDLHLEFGDIDLPNLHGADVLILSGDIMVAQDLRLNAVTQPDHEHTNARKSARKAQRYRDFLQRCSDQFRHVIYVAGNHEFYHGNFHSSLDYLREEIGRYPNVSFLENDFRIIDDVLFVGATLWTDCNRGDPMTAHALPDMINDFRVIRNDHAGYRRLSTEDIADRHRQTLDYFGSVLAEHKDSQCVVVGHHAPSSLSTHERYRDHTIMNGGFVSNLESFILDRPQICLWTHGHMHDPFDYELGSCRVVCNPRGYVGYEPQADGFELKYVEI